MGDKDPGFVVINRNILDWEWFTDPNTLLVFMYLLIKANWKDKTWGKRKIKRGQLVTSLAKIAEETGLSVRNVRTTLEHLQATNQVTSESTSQYRIITIKNYDKYQGVTNKPASRRQANDKPSTSERQANDKRPTTTKQREQDNTSYYQEQRNKGTSASAQFAPSGQEGQGQKIYLDDYYRERDGG